MKYTFIDIGCGNSNVSVDVYGLNAHGLLVDPIQEFCDILPTSNTVITECTAITDYDGVIEMNTWKIDTSILRYYPIQAISNLKHINRLLENGHRIYGGESILKSHDEQIPRIVSCMKLETLFRKHNINEVQQLKIDVEGYENILLNELIHLMRSNKFKVTERLIFEYNDLSNKDELDELTKIICDEFNFTAAFKKLGLNEDMILTKMKD